MEKRVFEFTNYDVPVTIAGHEFTMDCSSDTGDYLQKVSKELKNLSAEMAAGTKTKDDVISYGMGVIDKLLGAGAAAKVLGNREHKLSDVLDLCVFLSETAAAFKAERQKIQGNRAQRRAAAKKGK